MWLTVEKSGVHNQRRDLGVDVFVDPTPGREGRESLVLTAAHTVLPEAGTEGLPDIARREVGQGLTGRVREAMAQCEVGSPMIAELRDDLVSRLSGGRSGLLGAMVVADQVHLRRLVRGAVPAVIAVGSMLWYDFYRLEENPYAEETERLRQLYDAWKQQAGERRRVEKQMWEIAVTIVGAHPDDLLDVAV